MQPTGETSQRRGRATVLALISFATGGCIQDVTVSNDRYELHLRVIRHDLIAGSAAANVSVANAVWQYGTVEIYDSLNLNTAVTVPTDSCGLEVKSVVTEVTQQGLPLDSVLVVRREVSPGEVVNSGEAVSFFTPYSPILTSADTVPVFLIPYLAIEFYDGTRATNVLGFTDPDGSLGPSVWLGSELILDAGALSTMAHEFGHLVLPRPPESPFDDNATDFLNIMDYPGFGDYKYRRQAGISLQLELVLPTESNVRQLIEVSGHNQCNYALRPAPNVLRIQVP